MKDPRKAHLLMLVFWPLTLLVLFCDSRLVAGSGWNGQLLSNLLTPAFLLLLIGQMRLDRQLLVVLFVPLSAIGEALFSLLFGLYTYRLGGVPLYVPFGHSILMSIGLLLADSDFVLRHERRVQRALVVFHGSLIGGALLLRGDTFSLILGLIFLLILRGSGRRTFYLIMGVLVLYIELLGTLWGCWVWRPSPFDLLHTVNPPPGAFVCYVIADIIAIAIAARIEPWLARRVAARSGAAS